MSTPVTLERYAEMRADMEAGTLRDEVLARSGMTVDAWLAAQRTWLERMGTEIERGRFELTNRYTQAFLERQRALQSAARPAPDPPSSPAPRSDRPPSTKPVPRAPLPSPATPFVTVSSVELPIQPRSPVVPSAGEVHSPWAPAGQTAPPDSSPVREPLPFAPARARADEAGDPSPDVPPGSRPPRLSLEEHAQLSAELAFYPTSGAEVLQRYAIDQEERLKLDDFWGSRMRLDEILRGTWEELCNEHRARLLRTRGTRR